MHGLPLKAVVSGRYRPPRAGRTSARRQGHTQHLALGALASRLACYGECRAIHECENTTQQLLSRFKRIDLRT